MNIFLQIFLYIDVFLIGVATTLAIRHYKAHVETKKPVERRLPGPAVNISQEMREKLLAQANDKYAHILNRSAEQLDHELSATAERINSTVKKLAANVITKELEGFQTIFKEYQQKTAQELEDTKTKTDQLQTELKQKLEQEAETERQRLIDIIDTKMADVVMSFLLESLGHEIDLGSQNDYLLKQLDAHKEELKKAVNSEA